MAGHFALRPPGLYPEYYPAFCLALLAAPRTASSARQNAG